jgi:hypothetical protein
VPGEGGGQLVGVGVERAAITSGPEEPFSRHFLLAGKAMAPKIAARASGSSSGGRAARARSNRAEASPVTGSRV